jgi:hypothetical protein
VLCLLVLTCTEQGDTSISEEVKREINDLVDRNREASGIFAVNGKLVDVETCVEISLTRVESLSRDGVRCISFLCRVPCAADHASG